MLDLGQDFSDVVAHGVEQEPLTITIGDRDIMGNPINALPQD